MSEETDRNPEWATVSAVRPPTWSAQYRYSPATIFDDFVFVSGQVGVDVSGEVVSDEFLPQAQRAFVNLEAVLGQAGSSLDCILRVGLFLVDQRDFIHIPDLRGRYFTKPYPADTTVVVQSLARPGLLFEIDAIAHRK